jgi:hypothetical protein
MDEDIPQLARAIRRERIERARRMSPESKFRAGAELFDYACEITKAGIRFENPGADEDEVMRQLRRRLDLRARREDR